jgi:BASS family bile acid:Na+ symporter
LPQEIIHLLVSSGVAPVAFLLMFAVGLSLDLRELAASLRPIHRLTTDLFLAIALPPAAALLTLPITKPAPETAAAILLIAACPVGDIANAYTLLARGSLARSLSLNALTAMLAPVSMLAVFSTYSLFGADHQLMAVPPAELSCRLALLLLLPVSLGMLIRHRAPRFATLVLPTMARLTSAAILLLLVLVLANPASRPDDISGTLGSSAIFLALSMVLGLALLPLLRRKSGERTSIILCLPVRNVGIAALIAVSLLDDSRMVGVAAVYFALEVLLFLPLVIVLGRRNAIPASC